MFLIDDLIAMMAAAAPTAAAAAPTIGPTLGNAAALAAPTATSAALPAAASSLSIENLLNSAITGASQAPTGFMGMASKFAPNLTGMGKNLMGGNFQGAGANIGNMVGGKTLGDMIAQPSWANLGKMGEGLGDKLALSMMTGGGQPQQQAMGPGAVGTKQKLSTPMPEIEDPILQRMFQNLNQGQGQGFQGATMKSWGPSPYPRKMSSV